jgi:TonB family protein
VSIFPANTSRLCALLVATLIFPAVASAQFSKLDDVGEQLAKKLKPLKPKLVAVADFSSPDGSATGQAHYFAWFLSSSIQEHGKKHLNVAEHNAFDKDLAKVLGSPSARLTSESFHDAASGIGADVVIIGTVVRRDSSYVFVVSPVQVSTSRTILEPVNTSMRVSEFLDSLLTPFPAKGNDPIFKGGVGGIGMPKCLHCPDPSYNLFARGQNIQGISTFMVVVSPDGQAHQIRPVKLLGYGLDEEAYNTIKKWRFEPATNKDGTPVSASVPVEVTFRLF